MKEIICPHCDEEIYIADERNQPVPDEPRTTDAEVKDLRVLIPTLQMVMKDRPEAMTFTLSRDILYALLLQSGQNLIRLERYDKVRKSIYDTLSDDETVGHIGFVKANTLREIIKAMDANGDAR